MKKKTVVILDDNISSPKVLKHTILQLKVNEDLSTDVIKETIDEGVSDNESNRFDTHADMCAKIILKYADNPPDLINIIVKDAADGQCNAFLRGLDICAYLNIDLVNISIGIMNPSVLEKYMLHRCIKKITKNGTGVIAAYSNELKMTWPAGFDEVVGCVSLSRSNKKFKNCFAAEGRHYIRDNNGAIMLTSDSNSFATAYITGLKCNNS